MRLAFMHTITGMMRNPMSLVIHNYLKRYKNFPTNFVHKIALEQELKFSEHGCLKSVAITIFLQHSFLYFYAYHYLFYKGFLRQV